MIRYLILRSKVKTKISIDFDIFPQNKGFEKMYLLEYTVSEERFLFKSFYYFRYILLRENVQGR